MPRPEVYLSPDPSGGSQPQTRRERREAARQARRGSQTVSNRRGFLATTAGLVGLAVVGGGALLYNRIQAGTPEPTRPSVLPTNAPREQKSTAVSLPRPTETVRPIMATKPTIEATSQVEQSPFSNWERYRNGFIPKNAVIKMGKHMTRQSEYESIVDAGRGLITTQEQPQVLASVDPLLFQPISLPVKMTDIKVDVSDVLSIVDGESGTFIFGTDRNPNVLTIAGVRMKKVSTHMELDNRLINASEHLKMLALTYRIITLGHFKVAREMMYADLARSRGIPMDILSAYDAVFMGTAMAMRSGFPDPKISESFTNLLNDVEGVGMFEIMRSYGRLKDEGKLTASDVALVPDYEKAFVGALNNGMLAKNPNGQYEWKKGNAYSRDWLDMIRPIMQSQVQPHIGPPVKPLGQLF